MIDDHADGSQSDIIVTLVPSSGKADLYAMPQSQLLYCRNEPGLTGGRCDIDMIAVTLSANCRRRKSHISGTFIDRLE